MTEFLDRFTQRRQAGFCVFNAFENGCETPVVIKVAAGLAPLAVVVWEHEQDAADFAANNPVPRKIVRKLSVDEAAQRIAERTPQSVSGFAIVMKVPREQSVSGYHVVGYSQRS